jgi:serine/threonine protein kinase
MFCGSFDVDRRYHVDEAIGGGSVTLVFGARHLVLGRSVVLKVLRAELAEDDDQARRFLEAARAASHLQHENIVSISDLGHDAEIGMTYLVMERMAGVTLDRALETPLALDRALRILLQISRALGAAHTAGVVHGALGPRSIFLGQTSGRDDQVKIADFGLSTAALQPGERDHRVDLYGFGLTAYEVLAGRPPHRATPPEARKGEAEPPKALAPRPELPKELDELITRCLAFDPADRPASAAEIEAVLTRLIEGGTPAQQPQGSMVGQMIGTHKVVRLIGTGGIGTVYQAEHPVIGTQVAIKVLRPEIAVEPTMVERFVLEARASSMVGSPHIPRFVDFGYLPNGQPYAMMEYLSGETLATRLARDGQLSLGEVVAIVTQAASAMTLAHARGIIHRDLKPDNLFLSRDDAGGLLVKVLDFGIAKLVSADVATKTQTGLVFGTLVYCAPEQALGASVGPAADVYALGATTFEMLTGQPPFKAAPSCLAEKTTKSAPNVHKLRPDLPEAVARDLAAMLSRNAAARPSMQQLLALLEGWTRAEPSAAEPPAQTEGDAPAEASAAVTTTAATATASDSIDELPPMSEDDDAFDEPVQRPSQMRWIMIVGGVAVGVLLLVLFFTIGGDIDHPKKADDKAQIDKPRGDKAAADKKATVDKATADKATADKATADKAAADKAAADKASADRVSADKAAADKLAAERDAVDKAAGQIAAEHAAVDKANKAAADKAAADKAAADKAVADKAANKAAADKAAADKAAADKAAVEQARVLANKLGDPAAATKTVDKTDKKSSSSDAKRTSSKKTKPTAQPSDGVIVDPFKD